MGPPASRSQSKAPAVTEEEPQDVQSMFQAIMARMSSTEQAFNNLADRVTTLETSRRDYSVEEPDKTPTPKDEPITTQPDTRFRPEEIGYFTGSPNDVKPFTERLTTIATVKGHRVIQANLVQLLKDEAWKWYHQEIPPHIKLGYNLATSIEPWCLAIEARFAPSRAELLAKLKTMEYTKKDLTRYPALEFIQDVLAITNQLNFSHADGLQHAYDAIEPVLRMNLPRPPVTADIAPWMQEVRNIYLMWQQAYNTYTKPPDQRQYNQNTYQSRPLYQTPNQSNNTHSQQYHKTILPPMLPQNRGPPQQQQQNQGYRPPYQNQRQLPAPPANAVYFVDGEGQEFEYDGAADAYVAIPGPGPPVDAPGHTQRSYGNTHDGDRVKSDAWHTVGAEHRCAQCPHYH